MTKSRTRRLCKKLRIGKFQEFGFSFSCTVVHELSSIDADSLLDDFIHELIEPRGLALIGSVSGGFVSYFGRGTATEEDRQSVEDWLKARPEFSKVIVTDLEDAWYMDMR